MSDRDICNIIKRHLASETTPVEDEQLDVWMHTDPLFKTWLEESIEQSGTDVPIEVANRIRKYSDTLFGDGSDMSGYVNSGLHETAMPVSHKPEAVETPRRNYWKYMAVAAVLCVVALTGILYFNINSEVNDKPLLAMTLAGERARLTLPDGSTVYLNHESDLSYQYDKKRKMRIVQMHGEVAFDVATDPSKPFMVYCDGLEVECRGTRFNVKGYPDDKCIETVLINGAITARTNSQAVTMKPGTKVTYQKHRQTLLSSMTDLANYTEWQNINYDKFHDDRLEDILKTLSHRYGVNFAITNPELRDLRLSGSIGSKSLKEAIDIVASVSDTKYMVESDSVIYFYRRLPQAK